MCLLLSRRNMILSTPVKHLGEGNGTPLQYSCLEIPWWRSLVGCSPWGREESGTTEQLHFPFSLSCIGEGNGNLLQYSCLENPRDSRAWWAAVSGVTQSRTRLKRLSSSSEASMYPSQTAQTPHHILVPDASNRRTYYDFSFMPFSIGLPHMYVQRKDILLSLFSMKRMILSGNLWFLPQQNAFLIHPYWFR